MDATQERLQTRSKNKGQHPGQPQIDAQVKRRSRAEMEEFREEQEAKKREVQIKKNAVINRIAQMEDDMATQDRTKGRNHPRNRKGGHVILLLALLRYWSKQTDMEDEDHAANNQSDDSVPPQPKKICTAKKGKPAPKPRVNGKPAPKPKPVPKPRGKGQAQIGKGIYILTISWLMIGHWRLGALEGPMESNVDENGTDLAEATPRRHNKRGLFILFIYLQL